MTDGEFARDLRLRLLREHLDRAADGSEDGGLIDPISAVDEIVSAAKALDDWHTSAARARARRADCARTRPRNWACSRDCGPSPCTG